MKPTATLSRMFLISLLGVALTTACAARRGREPGEPAVAPTPVAVTAPSSLPTLPPVWTTVSADADAVTPAEPASAIAVPAVTEPGPAATASAASEAAGDEVERLLDELGAALDQTDTLTDANDLIP